jgi:membrane associated rhomboid family serine protease
MVVCAAVYLLEAFGGRHGLIGAFGLIPARVGSGEVWRLFTYQFLHGGVWHLAMNMLMLWMFGSELEQRWGRRFFLKYYFLCAVGGGLVYTLVRHGTLVASVGASGAIYGILMAYAVWFPNRQVFLWFLFPIRVRYLVIFLMAIEAIQAIESTGTGIAHAAHFGGMAFGYVYLKWWSGRGSGSNPFAGLGPGGLRRAWYRWQFRRLQRRRMGNDGGPTIH